MSRRSGRARPRSERRQQAVVIMSTPCASCGHPLDGVYCSRCGEERLDPRKLTVRYFLTHTVPSEILDLDGKVWRTFKLLMFRPGFLAVEYASGRRRLYVKPLRALLIVIVTYTLITAGRTIFTLGIPGTDMKVSTVPAAFPAGKSIGATLFQVDRFGILRRLYEVKMGPVERATDDVRDRFSAVLNAAATGLSFTSVVLLALAFYACFHRRRHLLVEHLVFSMNYLSFLLISSLILVSAFRLREHGTPFVLASLLAVMIWQLAYLAVSIRRFYLPDSRRIVAWPMVGLLAALFNLLNAFFITAVQFAAGAFAIWWL